MKDNLLLIYAPQTSTRLQYIAYVLFDQLLGVDFQIVTNKQSYLDYSFAKINYSNQLLEEQEIQIPNSNLLFEKGIAKFPLKVDRFEDLPIFFALSSPTATLPFDLFSMAFFLLSRYEEYLPFSPDMHGRFSATTSVAARHDFLQLPIVELWLNKLKTILIQHFPTLSFPQKNFCFSPTYDIDLAWAYLNRPWWRTIGSWLKKVVNGEWQLVFQQQNVLCRRHIDPYDTFAYLQQLHSQSRAIPTYFFLLADYAKYDTNIAPTNTALQLLIKTLHKQYQIGIHPSYKSNSSFGKLNKEIERLRQIIDEPIQHSRQHFLKLHLPDTYQNLLKLGITNDYSMGYADQIGFRAGISQPFFWYDLSRETMTDLVIHPFCVMDVTLQQYLQLKPSTAVSLVRPMIEQLQQIGGTFSTLWHNSSFSTMHGWAGWQVAYQQIVDLANKYCRNN